LCRQQPTNAWQHQHHQVFCIMCARVGSALCSLCHVVTQQFTLWVCCLDGWTMPSAIQLWYASSLAW
jgi:hypothetical protein